MKLHHRRKFLHLAAGAAALPTTSRIARAQAYPTRPVRLLVGFAAGGPIDVAARIVSQLLSERLGQQVIVENRPGFGGNIAVEAVVRAPPDGYTLLTVTASNATNTALFENKLTFNFIDEIAPVAGVMRQPFVMEVNPALPTRTLTEFISYAKANPGRISMASGGSGSAPHVIGELFKMMTGIDMVHVPYRGNAPAMTDLIAGQVDILFDTIPSSIEHIRRGTLRALGVTSRTRAEVLPQVPAIAEFVPGYEAMSFVGIGAPKNTPLAIIEKLNQQVNAALASPTVVMRIADLGGTVNAGTSADFGRLVVSETEKWAKVIRAANIKPE